VGINKVERERDPMLGVAIGRYVLQSMLARGGMGAVYLAVHQTLGVKKVVKVLLPEHSRREVIRQRFEREARAASTFGNPHIVPIDDFGALPDGQLFLMMPFLSGKPLDVHIGQHGRLSQHHTLQIMVQVCDALKTLHDNGVVHRDLKPGNIFISETPDNAYHVTVIDFGIARVARPAQPDDLAIKTRAGMAMGTPGYMAVEQFADAGNAGPVADLYSAAIITWEMLTGQLPWGWHDPRVLYHRQMTALPKPPADHSMSPELLALLRRTLSPRQAERPATAQIFAGAFASLTPPIPPHVPSGAEILARYAKRLVLHVSPDIETVRNVSSADRSGPFLLWPARDTAVPRHATPPPRPDPTIADTSPAPTVNRRRRPVAPATPSTLDGATIVRPSRPRLQTRSTIALIAARAPRWSTIALLGLLGCAAAGVIGFAIVQLGRTSAAGTPDQPVNATTEVHMIEVEPIEPAPAPLAPATRPTGADAGMPVNARKAPRLESHAR
jgi:serine/threonine-protein kinase